MYELVNYNLVNRMPSRLSTLLREDAIDLGKHIFKDKNEKKSAENHAEQKQNEILYNGDNSLYKTCIICDKKLDGKRTDHFLSAITDKTARFRDGKMLSIGHPMNLVYCCTGCNNEQKKKKRIDDIPRIKNYYTYLINFLPTNKFTEYEWNEHSLLTKKSEDERIARVKELHLKHL